ncbi:MAG: GNAT family N-acetyltransferase [Spirochaetes bacterium]|nr:GNAT family N-acetyltransferase [Spirochaetota bacterium]
MDNYIFRRAENNNDCSKLKILFNEVFYPEKVGNLAEYFFYNLPGLKKSGWFIAEEKITGKIVSACALIPWKLNFEGIELNTAEMGIVATDKSHQRKGLMKHLAAEFNRELISSDYDISIIQGIPGFYHKMGYYYSISFENHINLPLECIPESSGNDFNIRPADENDIIFLMNEDQMMSEKFTVTVKRSHDEWKYLINTTEENEPEYAGEFYICENSRQKFYFKINLHGFGEGLILSEASSGISPEAAAAVFGFCSKLCEARHKPYVRINLHENAALSETAFALGAEPDAAYAWQIKIPDICRFIKKISPVLEQRLSASEMKNITAVYRLNMYSSMTDIYIISGKIISAVNYCSPEDSELHIENLKEKISETENTEMMKNIFTLNIREDMLPVIIFGHKSLEKLYRFRPDTFTETPQAQLLTNTLFPEKDSWIYCRY